MLNLLGLGKKLDLHHLDEFLHAWGALFNKSPTARHAYRASLKHACPYLNNDTRWYTEWEVAAEIKKDWSQIPSFLHEYKINHDKKAKALNRLLPIFDNGMFIDFFF